MEDTVDVHGIAPSMDGDHSGSAIVMSEQQQAEFCLTLMTFIYGHRRQPVDAGLLRRLQRRRGVDPPLPLRRARVVQNTEVNVQFTYTRRDGLPSPEFDDDGAIAGYFQADDDAYSNGGFGAVPALSEAIVSLPEMAVSDARKECRVCLEEFEEGDKLRKMPFAHYFHESCVFKWLQVSRLCPYCRFAMPSEVDDDDDVDGEEHDGEEEDEATMCIRFLFPE